ncbi:ABC transporter permease [Propionispora hippei]|uniref:Nucleoside ABC transporter membrane protein n=1 Tax=Propionispora hippei DSM 15287 TaxID=1123003 RepID=A0A1M6MY42_9FIRM|nr:ABC transporter permease [Propionispora hippei]SHJ88365.1 nucleoside ABC transporter membrane protein [Propionispora hippei DSM 15287]
MNFHKQKEVITLLATILLGLIAGALFMLFAGHDPLTGYKFLFRGGLMSLERVGNTLATATPLIFTGLSVAFAFKTGLFNIGAAGQMLFGGFCATAVGLTLPLDKPVLLLVMALVAMLAGALWAALPGWFKARFNVHEVVSTIMFNWIAYWLVYYFVPLYFKGSFETESRNIPLEASLRTPWLSQMFDGSYINIGLLLALAAVVLCAFLLQRTTLGFELKAVGFNRFAAEYAGIHAGRSIVVSMMLAGALAGLGGMTLYCGYATNIQIGILPSQGIDGIAVALLGANSPWGVLAAALFFGTLYSGKGFMNAMTSIPPEIADTIIATIIYFAATSVLIEKFLDRLWRKQQSKEGA